MWLNPMEVPRSIMTLMIVICWMGVTVRGVKMNNVNRTRDVMVVRSRRVGRVIKSRVSPGAVWLRFTGKNDGSATHVLFVFIKGRLLGSGDLGRNMPGYCTRGLSDDGGGINTN